MASTYTTNLKIQEIASGEQSGYWGTTTNTNWTLIEQAVAGVVTIDMANADYTLTNLNGVSDEARNMVIKATGTNSGIRKIVAPLNQTKIYIVSNETTGGYAITIGASTGSFITIPSGVTAQVYTDGTNFYSSQTGSAGNFNVNGNETISGNLSVTGTSTLTGATTVGSTLGVTGAQTNSSTLQATTITATTQFSGAGTGLTGTASALSIGGNAATATSPASGGSFITSSNIGSQSVSYANSAGSASSASSAGYAGTAGVANNLNYSNQYTVAGMTVNNSVSCQPGTGYGDAGQALVGAGNRLGTFYVNGNTLVFYVDATQCGINFFISDETVKKNIAPSSYNALNTVKQIQFKSFDWNEDKIFLEGHVNCGVVAQQLQKVDSSLVSDAGDLLQPNVDKLLYVAMKAIQELEAKVAALEAK